MDVFNALRDMCESIDSDTCCIEQEGKNAVYLAAQYGSDSVVRLLLGAKASANDPCNVSFHSSICRYICIQSLGVDLEVSIRPGKII